jgi:hypothetical protein
MIVTREMVAERLGDYLGHRITLALLVDWAEDALQEGELEEDHLDAIRGVLARLGVADERAFGLTWDDSEACLRRLGYQARVQVQVAAGAGSTA